MAALKAFAFLAVCDPRFSFGKGTASSDRPDQTGPDQTGPDQTGPNNLQVKASSVMCCNPGV
ncbi:MAG: hypothetical protein CMM71_02630 [Rhodospirillaceae bacterium]|jgi:hypothetical protein|nr:hypothetical protein [Rhodospirillaceae bacterium]